MIATGKPASDPAVSSRSRGDDHYFCNTHVCQDSNNCFKTELQSVNIALSFGVKLAVLTCELKSTERILGTVTFALASQLQDV